MRSKANKYLISITNESYWYYEPNLKAWMDSEVLENMHCKRQKLRWERKGELLQEATEKTTCGQ